MTPEQIERTRVKLRDAIWQAMYFDVPQTPEAAIDALVRFERAEAAERWGWMYCRDAAVYQEAEAELARIVRETLGEDA